MPEEAIPALGGGLLEYVRKCLCMCVRACVPGKPGLLQLTLLSPSSTSALDCPGLPGPSQQPGLTFLGAERLYPTPTKNKPPRRWELQVNSCQVLVPAGGLSMPSRTPLTLYPHGKRGSGRSRGPGRSKRRGV